MDDIEPLEIYDGETDRLLLVCYDEEYHDVDLVIERSDGSQVNVILQDDEIEDLIDFLRRTLKAKVRSR